MQIDKPDHTPSHSSIASTTVGDKGLVAREQWLDIAKGYGIVLVVLGHTLRGLVASHVVEWSPAARFADNFIYSFHMPLFFFLSSLLLERTMRKPFTVFLGDKARTIVYPYLIWSVITLLIKALVGDLVNYPRGLQELPQILYAPIEQFWFLYALFGTTVATAIFFKLGGERWIALVLALLIFPGVSPPVFPEWTALNQIRQSEIYAVLGVLCASGLTIERMGRIRSRLSLALTAVIGFLLLYLAIAYFGAPKNPLLQISFAVTGGVATIALAIFSARSTNSRLFQVLGIYSLEIFILHTLVSASIRIFLQHVTHVSSFWLFMTTGTIGGLLIPILIALGLRHFGVEFAFTFPRSSRSSPVVS